jgi:threonine/homoserine/homoserine lactone efflux protein
VFDLVDIICKGFLIGILVSAPMGPIGLLCLQRTLNKGRWHGFFTGVGAAFSDIFYGGITCLGMGYIINFITANQYALQIVGSAVLMGFGVYIFRSNPFKRLYKPKENSNSSYSYSQTTATAFILTLSNPLILFLFIALFARFNFIVPEEKWLSIAVGLASILMGALFWWFMITFFVGKLRAKINFRGLLIMNRTIGSIIVGISVYYLILTLNHIVIV